jgi:hypothetical protein
LDLKGFLFFRQLFLVDMFDSASLIVFLAHDNFF